jgi:hypothetical protein
VYKNILFQGRDPYTIQEKTDQTDLKAEMWIQRD